VAGRAGLLTDVTSSESINSVMADRRCATDQDCEAQPTGVAKAWFSPAGARGRAILRALRRSLNPREDPLDDPPPRVNSESDLIGAKSPALRVQGKRTGSDGRLINVVWGQPTLHCSCP
jgi:hypothetical protein